MIAEFDECPICGTGPMVSVRVDKHSITAIYLRCGCGEIDYPVPLGLGMETLARAWNVHVRQHIRDRAQTAMVDAMGRQFAEGREVGVCKAVDPMEKGQR